jgi:hypothetical protein
LGQFKNVPQPSFAGVNGEPNDAFVASFTDTGVLRYCTYLGGTGSDIGGAIDVGLTGVAYVTGRTASGDFPITAGSFQTGLKGTDDAFVTTVSFTGEQFFYSTYLGGTGIEVNFGGPPSVRADIAVDPDGNVYVVGATDSTNFPVTTAAFQKTLKGPFDAFLAKIRPDASLPTGQELIYATYLGGAGQDLADCVDWRATKDGFAATVAGLTQFSPDFPLVNPLFTVNSVFVTQLNAAGSQLTFSTRLADINTDLPDPGLGMRQGLWGDIWVTGHNGGPWPTTVGAYQGTFAGARDAWLMRIRPSAFEVKVTSCATTPTSLPVSGGAASISAAVTSSIALESVVARITGPAQQVQDLPLQLQSGVYKGTFNAPANSTTAVQTYSVTIIATDEDGTTGSRPCSNITVAKGQVQVTSCSVEPNALPSTGGAANISANVTSTLPVSSVLARITGPANQTQDVPLTLEGKVYRGVFNAPQNFTTTAQTYHVVIIAADGPGNTGNRDCGNLTVAAGALVITQASVTPSELPSKGGGVKISATVAGTERVKSVKAIIQLPTGGKRTVRLTLKRGVYSARFRAPRNRKDEPMVYSVVVSAAGRAGTKTSRNAGVFTVAAAE